MTTPAMFGVGTLATGITAEVDAHGTVHQGSLRLGWRVRSETGWLVPGRDRPVYRSRPHPAPVAHTTMRVAGGVAIERVYAVGDGDAAVVVVEVENDSPEAIAVAFVVDAPGVVAIADDGVCVDANPAVAFARRPGAVEDGGLVYPVPHRTAVRVALTGAPVDVRALASADAVARAWDRVLDRGMRTELPETLQTEIDAARTDLLLAPPSADAFVALETWGFDGEATEMWGRLRMRARRAAKRSSAAHSSGRDVLGQTRAALVREEDRTIEILPGFRVEWLGQQLAVHDVPLRRGSCSFAVRWHGARPALLWDVPPGSTVRVPELDPGWSSDQPAGEALLAAAPASLVSMGERATLPGAGVDAPEQFS